MLTNRPKNERTMSLKDLVTHLPKKQYRRCWVPLEEPGRRRTYWTDTKRTSLRHMGDVTIILSQQRRNHGPKPTNILVTNLPAVSARRMVDVYRRRWSVEVYQTQPIKMPRCPLRNVSRTMTSLRGQYKRERIVDIDLLPGYDDFTDQALRDCLAFFKGEPAQIVAQQMPKGVGVFNDLWPMPRLLLGTSELLPFLLDLFSFGSEFPPSTLQLIEADDLSLIGIE
jgi:hypothetical protein